MAVDASTVDDLRQHWEEGWNHSNVDVIMAPFAPDVVFSSPFISRLTGDPTATQIRGFEAVRKYCAESFVRATSGITYTVDAAYAGTDSVVLQYTVHHPIFGDRRGVDTMRLGANGKVVQWSCHYDFEP